MNSTANRVPLTTGLPTRMAGSTTMRSCQLMALPLANSPAADAPGSPSNPLPQDGPRRIPTGSTDDAAARVCRRAAQKQLLDRRLVTRVARRRPQHEQLVEQHRALEDVAAGQPEGALQVQRRN